ncbi:MAG: ATP-dependent helicase HrpB, partial [Rhizobiaceae bacterium]
VLEPRRLAARAAAQRMAPLLGEKLGETVGYRVRFDSRIGARTRIEVVTEGVFTRMLMEDPGLESVAIVVFDEFHERSLDGDLALALCLDLQAGLHDDLRLLPMSATLDGAAVADLLDCAIIESQGRSYPVEILYRERRPNGRIEAAVCDAVIDEFARPETSNILVFLPGQGEIERTASQLENRLPYDVELHRLYGALPQKFQDAAIAPPLEKRRKLVLSSAIAETSLTIEGVTTVIDSGLARLPVFEPATGLTRLQTVRASQASVAQRAGRAGRLGPGRAVRLWRAEQTAALPAHAPPEIANGDLTTFILALSDWGVRDPAQLRWLDSPPSPAIAEAQNLLTSLGALGADKALTAHGRSLIRLPLPARLAHIVLQASCLSKPAASKAALLCLLVQERGAGGESIDLDERFAKVAASGKGHGGRLLKLASSIARRAAEAQDKDGLAITQASTHDDPQPGAGTLLAVGYKDRIAQRRGQGPNGTIRYKLTNGRGAELDAVSHLATHEFLVVLDMIGRAGAARILSAVALDRAQLNDIFGDEFKQQTTISFDPKTGQLDAFRTIRFGELELGKPERIKISGRQAVPALLDAVRDHGLSILPWRDTDRQLRERLLILHKHIGEPWPDLGDQNLLDSLGDWLKPFLMNATSLQDLAGSAISNGLMMLAGHPAMTELDRLVPTHFTAPSGSRIKLDYQAAAVVLRVRPQELFGLDSHPCVLDGKVRLDIEILSPAGRPIQITQDLPGFWRGSWRDVRSEMRGRYPKHPWPEDALSAIPTARSKPRGKSG